MLSRACSQVYRAMPEGVAELAAHNDVHEYNYYWTCCSHWEEQARARTWQHRLGIRRRSCSEPRPFGSREFSTLVFEFARAQASNVMHARQSWESQNADVGLPCHRAMAR